jgi:hypothetical protein
MSAYDLVEEVKKKANIQSDNALGIAIGKTRSTVSNWKQGVSKPDGETVLKLITLGNVDPKEALKLMQGGYATVSLMAMTAGLSIALFTCNLYANPLYIMLNYYHAVFSH